MAKPQTSPSVKPPSKPRLEAMWDRHNAAWRSTAEVASQWGQANSIDERLFEWRTTKGWWQLLADLEITLIVGREYEHFLLALTVRDGRPLVSHMPLPHPSGIAVNREDGLMHVASTRNPNQIFDLEPIGECIDRKDARSRIDGPVLVPVKSRFLPGCTYLHDLALVGGKLYGNAVGSNAVASFDDKNNAEFEWWPKCIERDGKPDFGQNYIQLNSIAAGADLAHSFFSASSSKISNRRPGHANYAVDRRGVIFSGLTREPCVFGLTRPHSARLQDDRLWVDNSGYGEFGYVDGQAFSAVRKLNGWTRGLCFHKNVAFVGTSRVIPKFRHYAPGVDLDDAVCGVHAIDCTTGKLLASIEWPWGNQIFAVDWLPRQTAQGFPFISGKTQDKTRELFYSFKRTLTGQQGGP